MVNTLRRELTARQAKVLKAVEDFILGHGYAPEISLDIDAESFAKEVAPARTFGFVSDLASYRSRGLALGSSLENTIGLDDEKVVNPPLRFPDEFVRHKVLDLLGDLALLGRPVLGHFRAWRAGHALHLQAVRFLLGRS